MMARCCEYIDMAWINGCLYEVGGYPGLVSSSRFSDKVVGELYRLLWPRQVLTALDDYEECSIDFPLPHEYVRKIQAVYGLATDNALMAWIYQFNRDVDGLRWISSGDYLRP